MTRSMALLGAAVLALAGTAAQAGGRHPWGGGSGHGIAAGPIAKPLPAPVPAPGGGTAVPEPGDAFLFAAGVAGLIIGRRSSRSKPRT